MGDKEKRSNKDLSRKKNLKASSQGFVRDEHRDWVKEEFNEGKREKKKAFGFEKKIVSKVDLRKKATLKGKFTHGTKGKPTHGPRGNQG